MELPKSTVETPAEVALDVVVTKKEILVNDAPVMVDGSDDPEKLVADDYKLIITPLFNKLMTFAKEAKKMEEMYGTKFSHKVTIQGDYRLPYKLLVKVMATCGRAEYGNMRLVVYKRRE